MRTAIRVIGATALAGLVALAAVAPAVAAPPPRGVRPLFGNHFVHRGHYGAGRRWGGYSYGRNYGGDYYGGGYYDPGEVIAGGIIGGVFGASAGSALSHGGGSQRARCEAAYRSYVPATNTYTGYDGLKHACRL